MARSEALTKLTDSGKLVWSLLSDTVDEFSKDRGHLLAAALAFYTLLSIAPLIIVAVGVAGLILDAGVARAEINRLLHDSMGPQAARTVNGWVDEAARTGGVATALGAVLLLFTASRLVSQLRSALNQVWSVDAFLARGFQGTVKDYVRRRLFAFGLVLASGPLLVLIVASRAVLTGLGDALFSGSPLAGFAVQAIQLLFSVALVTGITAVVFKLVPDTRIGWRSLWIGALLTSILFNLGNLLVGLYLGRATVSAAYGAAGSAVVVLLWMYFSAQLFLIGAEFTQVYAGRFGRGLKPEEERELREAARAGAREAGEAEEEEAASSARRAAGAAE